MIRTSRAARDSFDGDRAGFEKASGRLLADPNPTREAERRDDRRHIEEIRPEGTQDRELERSRPGGPRSLEENGQEQEPFTHTEGSEQQVEEDLCAIDREATCKRHGAHADEETDDGSNDTDHPG